jgi:hypothetical protein
MAVLYRPITNELGKRYDIEPYESAEKYTRPNEASSDGCCIRRNAFFLSFRKRLNQRYDTLFGESANEYSAEVAVRKKVGMVFFVSITSLKAMSKPLKKLEDWAFTNASPFSRLTKRKQTSKASN